METLVEKPVLIEDGSTPDLRAMIGQLMAGAQRSDFAVQHVRLAAIDLTPRELAHVHVRLLLGRFDADQLATLGSGDAGRQQLAVLGAFLDSGRAEVRAAGLLRWYPDFSIHHAVAGRTALLGIHQLSRQVSDASSLFTAVLEGAAATALARRFERLWRRAHDVRDVIRAELRARGA